MSLNILVCIASLTDNHGKTLPSGWEKMLSYQLKRLAAAGELVKVKASFKLGDALKKVRTLIFNCPCLAA